MYVLSIDTSTTSVRAQPERHALLAVACLGEMGEGARLRRLSHNHSSVLQSLKSSEAARNFFKKKKKRKESSMRLNLNFRFSGNVFFFKTIWLYEI